LDVFVGHSVTPSDGGRGRSAWGPGRLDAGWQRTCFAVSAGYHGVGGGGGDGVVFLSRIRRAVGTPARPRERIQSVSGTLRDNCA